MARVSKRVIIAALSALIAVSTAALVLPATSWRLKVLRLKQQGELQDVTWLQLLKMLHPRSPYNLQPVLSKKSLYFSLRNPYSGPKAVQAGEEQFSRRCAVCHGAEATGGTARSLVEGSMRNGVSDWAMYRAITEGVPGTAMKAQPLSDRDVWMLVAYIQAHRRSSDMASSPEDAKTRGRVVNIAPVYFDELQHPKPDDWLTYSGSYNSQRFSTLNQINRGNVSRLTMKWLLQSPSAEPFLEATPIVRDGIMFFSDAQNSVWALEAATGKRLWTYHRTLPRQMPLCCGMVNRGLAILGDRLYLGTLDAHLVALDVASGAVVWDVRVADSAAGYSITGAPLALNGKVITGIAGGEFGIRGFIAAYDAATGKEVWRFKTIPEPGQVGHETWTGDSWKTGGAPTWLTGSYDPQTNVIYWGVGNPAPDHDGRLRKGDNLYSNSAVALDGDSGKLKWHFQFTPHDERDWDAVQIPVLVDAQDVTAPKRILWANRNGFFYKLNRENGRFLDAQPFVRQNWATGFDSVGRPIVRPESALSEGGTLSYPALIGGTNWWSPAYNPELNLFYVPALDFGAIFFRLPPEEYRAGELFLGGEVRPLTTEPYQFSIRALEPRSGKKVWEFRPPPRVGLAQKMGGLLATSGGIVFGGDDTWLYALDAKVGKELWKINTGGIIAAAPITFAVDGKQYITVAAGRTVLTFSLPE
jgi:alcohol dehydrogenase (cytochrome c)